MPEFDVAGHGFDWLTTMFNRLGSDPSDAAFVAPGNVGVWTFIETMAGWFSNPRRHGL